MKPKISLVTLGVGDLERARRFYASLGLVERSESNDAVVFIQMGGTVLGLWRREALAEDAGVASDGSGFRGFSLAHNVASKTEVDEVLQEAENAGGRLVKSGQDAFWGGYTGYFEDPDGFLWEVAWNPGMPDLAAR
jgi:catechol 2,3-dioxygenase-like lactoylglutathione lyase family enzyme